MDKELNSGGHLISNIKNDTYFNLKSELQNVKGIDRDTQKKISKLTYELLEFYGDNKSLCITSYEANREFVVTKSFVFLNNHAKTKF